MQRVASSPLRNLPIRQLLYEIWLWAHSSQRATCPPRATVRQLSIADITFNWPRLTWPALALRHAGPWPRKISATSSLGRPTRAARQAGGTALGSFFLGLSGVRRSNGLMTSRI